MDYIVISALEPKPLRVNLTILSQPSDWPLANKSVRLVSPVVIRRKLEEHPLSRDCYPLAVGYYESASSHRMSRQRHDDNILIYCFAGKGYLHTDTWQGNIHSGELILLPSGSGHQYWADDHNPWSIYWCHFSGHLAPQYLAHIAAKPGGSVVPIGQSPALIAQFQTLLQATSNGYNITAMVHAASMLKQLLTAIALIISEKSEAQKNVFNVASIQTFMLQNLDKPLNLDTLAQQARLSKYHFSKKYRQITGHSPVQHLIHMKMEYARYLIETSDTPVRDIAVKVGHSDALYFSRQFKQVFGISPQQHRDKVQESL